MSEADIAPILTRMLAIDMDTDDFYELASSDARLSPPAQRSVGFRPPDSSPYSSRW